jgi:hypothetical protein
MSILLYDYKELTDCISEVERIECGVNNGKNKELTEKEKKNSRKGKTESCVKCMYIDEFFDSCFKIYKKYI